MANEYHKLSDTWILWFHDPYDTEWDLSSYKKIYEIDSVEVFWNIYNYIDKHLIVDGMFFVMKKGIDPMWEHKDNSDGGCWSYRVQKKNAYEAWLNLSMALCGNTLTSEKYLESINGISMSPKKSFCIIKIWNNDSKINDVRIINSIEKIDNRESIYKAHKDRSY